MKRVGRTTIVGGLALAPEGGLWVEDAIKSSFHLWDEAGKPLGSFSVEHFLGGFCFTPGEMVITSGLGPKLLYMYDTKGRETRRFGERIPYETPDLDAALNAGHVACWNDRVYLSLYHPPIVRAYSTEGALLWERKLKLQYEPIDPVITRTQTKDMVTVSSRYSLASLGVAVDSNGNLYVLKSGLNRFQALTSGSDLVEVFSPAGDYLAELTLSSPGHQIGIYSSYLFVLHRRPPSLERLSLAGLLPLSRH